MINTTNLYDDVWDDWRFSEIEYTQDFSIDRTIEELLTGNLYEATEHETIDFSIFASIIDRTLEIIKDNMGGH